MNIKFNIGTSLWSCYTVKIDIFNGFCYKTTKEQFFKTNNDTNLILKKKIFHAQL